MLAHLSHWILLAAFAQAPPEAALVKAAPAEVDLAVRVRSLEATRDDLLAMLKAMNPDWANMAEGRLADLLSQVREHHGAHAVATPFLALVRLGDAGGEDGPPPFAVLVPSEKYAETLKELVGGKDVDLKHEDGGYDAFDGPEGHGTVYAARLPGIVAFGNSKGLIADIAKPKGKTLDAVLSGSLAKSFFGGDVGVFVNAAALTSRFADQIDQARQQLMNAMDQAAQQAGNASVMQFAKDFYGGMFDSLKDADVLTVNLELGEKGLHLGGFLKVRPGSEGAKPSGATRTGVIADVGKFPADATVYLYMNLDAKTFDRLESMSLRMLSSDGKASPELEKAKAAIHGMGRMESITSLLMGKGMRSISEITVADPKTYIEASIAMLRAMKGGTGLGSVYKEVKIEPDAETYEGLKLTRVLASIDVEALAKLSGNKPEQAELMKSMLGDGTISYWLGTDGKRVFKVVSLKWEDAKAQLDAYFSGKGSVGQGAGFKTVGSELPEKASFLVFLNTQSLVRQMASLLATITKNPDLKPPDDMPKEPAFLGASLTAHPPEGYEVHLVLPSAVGTAIAKGVVPMIQGLAPRPVNQ